MAQVLIDLKVFLQEVEEDRVAVGEQKAWIPSWLPLCRLSGKQKEGVPSEITALLFPLLRN
jgi:hypothetical protein